MFHNKNKTVLITGTTYGIGKATSELFLKNGFNVIGFDIKPQSIRHKNYRHYQVDVSIKDQLPKLDQEINYIVNNAGVVDENKAIQVNLIGYINIIEKYAFQPHLESLINIASISAHGGIEGMKHSASQGARVSMTKNLAIELGRKYGTRVNSISPGAVLTNLEPELYKNEKLVQAVANENILKRWIMPEEIAEWIYFVSVINKSLTGQDILIDCGEFANFNFISY